jgi:hypothetical protein
MVLDLQPINVPMNATILFYRLFLWTILLVNLVKTSADFKVFTIINYIVL